MDHYGYTMIETSGRFVFPPSVRHDLGIAGGSKIVLHPVEHLVIAKCVRTKPTPYAIMTTFDDSGAIIIPAGLMNKQRWSQRKTRLDIYRNGNTLILTHVY
ncbi:MAG: hypothetical protein FWE05_13800 [Defluviitaleaceae bacterium]|nr:hypothetical protein [Defluviitaleaceae bacterium]